METELAAPVTNEDGQLLPDQPEIALAPTLPPEDEGAPDEEAHGGVDEPVIGHQVGAANDVPAEIVH